MKTYRSTIVTDEPLLKIQYDNDVESPREWTNLGYFITCDNKYNSPDTNDELQNIVKYTGEQAISQAEHMAMIKKDYKTEKIIAIYPIVKYEHSGVSYSLGEKHGFDYSNNGFYIITDKTLKNMPEKKKEWERIIKNELETYNQWMNGEVYRFNLYDKNGELIDGCCGFYDIESIREKLPKEWKKEDLNEYII